MTELLDVLGLEPFENAVRAAVLLLPAAVVLTLLVLWRVKARSKSKKKQHAMQAAPAAERVAVSGVPQPAAPGVGATAQSIATATDAASGAVSSVVSAIRHPSPQSASTASAPVAAETLGAPASTMPAPQPGPQPAPAAKAPPTVEPALPPTDFAAIKARFEEAVKVATKDALAPLYLEYASQCRTSGDEAACLAALRSAAGYGALHGPRVAHAAARVELAEAAYASGDAIGACEQWQIARLVLHEEGLKDAYARIDKRMRDNGCPTDWVLTDF